MKKLLIVLLVLGMAAPAMATEVQFYGKIRLHMGYYATDDDFSSPYLNGPRMDPTIAGPDDAGTLLSLSKSTRLGLVFKAHDALSGRLEMGLDEVDDERVYLRQAYGKWNFGPGELLLGKTYTPATFLGYSGMMGDLTDGGHGNLLPGGLPYIGRQPQIRLSFGDFDFALIQPYVSASTYGGEKDQYIPRLEAAYVFRTELMNIRPVLGYQTYDVDFSTSPDQTITSYLAGLGVSIKLGPAYIKATGSYMINGGNYGQQNVAILPGTTTNAKIFNNTVEDSELIMGTFVAGGRFNSRIAIEGGIGYQNAEVDTAPGITEEKTGMVYYLQMPIVLARGVRVVPEVALLDRGTRKTTGASDLELGQMKYFDVTFEVSF